MLLFGRGLSKIWRGDFHCFTQIKIRIRNITYMRIFEQLMQCVFLEKIQAKKFFKKYIDIGILGW